MTIETRVALQTFNQLKINGSIAELVKARKTYNCHACGLPIETREEHYCIYIGGGGLGSLKFPDRIHQKCINDYSNRRR
jgi:hypothetical protein